MDFISERAHAWILCHKDGNYYLSVMVQVSGAAWDIVFQLNEDEVADYVAQGDAAIDRIDQNCQNNLHAYSKRQVGGVISAEIHDTILLHRQQATVQAARAAFEAITPAAIIAYAKQLDAGHLYTKKPEEAYRSAYQYGQTVILRGRKDTYAHLIEFWLACESWYSDEDVEFDDYGAYDAWLSDENRVGVCLPPDAYTLGRVEERLSAIMPTLQVTHHLLMDPTWNDIKILFLSGEHYYLWNWWTGE